MTDLIHRLEQAEPGQERELLLIAMGALNPLLPFEGGEPSHEAINAHAEWNKAFARFRVLLDAQAFVDAAMMLVPEGCREWKVEHIGNSRIRKYEAWVLGAPRVGASTPAYAIAAASLKARETSRG